MKIVEWFLKIIRGKKQKLLSENNMQNNNENSFENKRRGLLSKLHRKVKNDVSKNIEKEELLRNLSKDVIVEDPFPYNTDYDYDEFMEKIKLKDKNCVLTEEDMTALSCIKDAICDGNDLLKTPKEIIKKVMYFPDSDKNVINEFLKEFPNNIIVLMDLMKQDAKRLLKEISGDYMDSTLPTIQSLIPGSYSDVTKLVEEYNKDKQAGIE